MARKFALVMIAFLIGCGAPQVPAEVPSVDAIAQDAAAVALPPENLNPTLWVQTSAEYWGASAQAYASAWGRLDAAIADKTWVATDEQAANFADKPPAIILDLDETVLDNSPYQARLIADGESFDPKTWDAWCNEAKAGAVPGALTFLAEAKAKGVTIFYVSNRDASTEEATRKNLAALGAPLDDVLDTVLLKKEQPEWGSDKRPRRAKVAQTHRIIMLFGDNLGDFVGDGKGDAATRRKVAEDNARRWGQSWFMIPNPMYGYWESALFDYKYGDPKPMRDAKKLDSLVPKR